MADSSLDAAAIREIERLVRAGQFAKFEHRDGDPPDVMHIMHPDGSIDFRTVEPAPINSVLRRPSHLVAFAEEMTAADKIEDGLVFYNESTAVLVCNRYERRDRAACPMVLTPQFTWLQQGSKGSMSQADFVRLLRITFRGCLPAESGLLALVRHLKWSGSSASTANLIHGAESMGKSISAQVTGEAAIPEEISLHVPVWENFPFRAHVRCAVEVLPHEQQFRLSPFPLELRAAIDNAVDELGRELERSKLPCFYGTP